ncbi:hypothetical protein FEM48_Zijuj09G0198800 [Ziziphus jujuba var. spinosa]|uniref:1-phosphatidylinositol 4-kinase n=1 Tax=Ziziphus jujuba var. spinosa TaxID=714518 RepID=A0A978UV01_ZIZJJ|nr:hypothetical protein FEM48_Zijuj09G0198800 [Ziziphus jujuba var. spinosa]
MCSTYDKWNSVKKIGENDLLQTLVIFQSYNGTAIGLRVKPPVLVAEGTRGVYFSVFKPVYEEPTSFNNPRGHTDASECFKKGVTAGEGTYREYGAYCLDHSGFFGVPPTIIVECSSLLFDNAAEGTI